jgi:GntR family transcriptional regulator
MSKKDFRPAYQKIIDDISDDILTGVYTKGDVVPTQAQLAQMYSVSRITVRDAINELIHRGFLYTKQGKGTFVDSLERFSYPHSRTMSFSRGIVHKGQHLRTTVLVSGYIRSDKSTSKKLSIPEGLDLFYLRRLRIVEGIPVVVTSSYLDRCYFQTVQFEKEDFSKQSLYAILEQEAKLVIDYADEEIKAIRCPSTVAQYLELKPGEPVLYIKRSTVDVHGKCFEWGEQFERTDFSGMKIRSRSTPPGTEKTTKENHEGS